MQFQNTKDYLQLINQYYHYILAGPLGFFAYIFLTRNGNSFKNHLGNVELVIPIIIGLGLICLLITVWATVVFVRSKRKILLQSPLFGRLKDFFKIFIRFQIALGIVSLFALVGLYLTGHGFFMGFYIVILFMSSIHRPSAQYLFKKIPVNDQEKEDILKQRV